MQQGTFFRYQESAAAWLAGTSFSRRGGAARWTFSFVLIGVALGLVPASASPRVEIVWPTPLPAWSEGRPRGEILQHAGSGDPESGGFGGVRTGGTQFHEGIDIKPLKRDRKGEPSDAVFAAMAGVVRHIARVAGNSSYGRYVVLEHPELDLPVYTLYAHLAQIAPELRAGDQVTIGQPLGTMGHTADRYVIPPDRAHLHFEIGVRMTDQFQAWYDARKFGSRNAHDVWNGMNLMGVDPLDFFEQWRAKKVDSFAEYFARMETAVVVRIATPRVPDFVRRYPALVSEPLPMSVGGWEVRFNATGVPFSWRPLGASDIMGLQPNRPVLREVDAAVEKRERSKTLAVHQRGEWRIGRDLNLVLQQLFGLR
jgi:murein DD-endopeptidase MepM/ murein hydrolase activator NlpD